MAPPQHKIDATLQAMEKAHRATPDDQVRVFSQTINTARRDFESFASAEEAASHQNANAGGSLLALVENEQELDKGLDRSLEKVKESLAEMERKRMLALGAMTRLSPEEALGELSKIKEHILNLSLRVPIRADFIVHGHNISLSIFRLFEAAERAEAEVDALINAKKSLDGNSPPENPLSRQPVVQSPNPVNVPPAPTPTSAPYSGQYPVQSSMTQSTEPSDIALSTKPTPSQYQSQYQAEVDFDLDQSPPSTPQSSFQQENYESTEIDLDLIEANDEQHITPESTSERPTRPRTPTTTGMRLRRALQKSGQTASRPLASSQPTPVLEDKEEDDQVFRGGDEEYDL